MSDPNPWADPATQTQPGSPYLGPPPTAPAVPYGYPPQYGQPAPYGYPGQGYSGYGYPGPWGPVPPRRPQRPGPVITSAVLAFVQGGVVLLASLYVWFFASVLGVVSQENPGVYADRMDSLSTEVTVLAILGIASVVLLVVAGIRALSARTRAAWLLTIAAHAVQIVLAVYWAVRLVTFMNDIPGPDSSAALAAVSIVFAAAPVVGLGLLLSTSSRRWFESPHRP
jgi:hypothetical protein